MRQPGRGRGPTQAPRPTRSSPWKAVCGSWQGGQRGKESPPPASDAPETPPPVAVLRGRLASDIRHGPQRRHPGVRQRETPCPAARIRKGCLRQGLRSWGGSSRRRAQPERRDGVGRCRPRWERRSAGSSGSPRRPPRWLLKPSHGLFPGLSPLCFPGQPPPRSAHTSHLLTPLPLPPGESPHSLA